VLTRCEWGGGGWGGGGGVGGVGGGGGGMARSIHRSGALCPDSITVPPVLSPPFSRHTVPSG